jgi:hypothetical protein
VKVPPTRFSAYSGSRGGWGRFLGRVAAILSPTSHEPDPGRTTIHELLPGCQVQLSFECLCLILLLGNFHPLVSGSFDAARHRLALASGRPVGNPSRAHPTTTTSLTPASLPHYLWAVGRVALGSVRVAAGCRGNGGSEAAPCGEQLANSGACHLLSGEEFGATAGNARFRLVDRGRASSRSS